MEKGKLANLVVVEGKTYFAKGAKINSTWIEGRPFQYFFDGDEKKDPPKDENASAMKRRRKENCPIPTFRAKGFGKPSRRTLYRVQAVDLPFG